MDETQLIQWLTFKFTSNEKGFKFFHPFPIICPASNEEVKFCLDESQIALKFDLTGEIVAVIDQPKFYLDPRKNFIFNWLYSNDLLNSKENENCYLVTGKSLKISNEIHLKDSYDQFDFTPSMIKTLIKTNQYDCIYAFKLNNQIFFESTIYKLNYLLLLQLDYSKIEKKKDNSNNISLLIIH